MLLLLPLFEAVASLVWPLMAIILKVYSRYAHQASIIDNLGSIPGSGIFKFSNNEYMPTKLERKKDSRIVNIERDGPTLKDGPHG
jgi:hypothetical protein